MVYCDGSATAAYYRLAMGTCVSSVKKKKSSFTLTSAKKKKEKKDTYSLSVYLMVLQVFVESELEWPCIDQKVKFDS